MPSLSGQHVCQTGLGTDEAAANVDLVNQVVTFDRSLKNGHPPERARIVDENVDAAERGHRLLDHVLNHGLIANVHSRRQGAAAQRLDFFGNGVNCTG